MRLGIARQNLSSHLRALGREVNEHLAVIVRGIDHIVPADGTGYEVRWNTDGSIAANPAAQYNQIAGGNQNLTPEKANTWTLGVAAEPVKNLIVSVDYYQIKIEDAIGATGAGTVLTNCLGTGVAYIWNQNVLRAWGPTRASTVTFASIAEMEQVQRRFDAGEVAPTYGIANMPLRAAFADQLPDVLQLLSLGKKSGCLSVAHRQSFGYIYFDRGRICYASIVNRRDRLGDILVKSGAISQAQLDQAIAEQTPQRDKRVVVTGLASPARPPVTDVGFGDTGSVGIGGLTTGSETRCPSREKSQSNRWPVRCEK